MTHLHSDDIEYIRNVEMNFTNKILTDSSNIISASYLNTPNGHVNIVSTPSVGKYLKVTASDTAEWSTSSSDPRINLVMIRSLADFPSPVGGVITLAPGAEYQIDGNVNIGTNRIVISAGSNIYGVVVDADIITYTGNGTAVTRSLTGYFRMQNLTITAPSGTCFNLSADSSSSMRIQNCIFKNSQSVGTIGNCDVTVFKSNYMQSNVNGLTFSGTIDQAVIFDNSFLDFTGPTIIDFNAATLSGINIGDNIFHTANPANIYLRNGSTTIYGTYYNNDDHTGFIAFTGFDSTTPGWQFRSNYGIADSRALGGIYMIGNVTATTFTGANTWTKVLGTTSTNYLERFTSGVSNRLTYTEARATRGLINITGAATCGSNNQDIKIAVAENGVVISSSAIPVGMKVSGDTYPFASTFTYNIGVGKYYEVFIQNTSSSTSVTVNAINFTIS